MSKQKFIFTLFAAVLVVLWMLFETLGSAKAAPNNNNNTHVTESYAIAGYHPGMSVADAKKNCENHNPNLNYAWLVHPAGYELAGCFIDPSKVIPPRDERPTEMSTYRHLQTHPAMAIAGIKNDKVASLFLIYFEPEQWKKELVRFGSSFELKSVEQKQHPNGVDYDVDVYYNDSSKMKLSGWFWYPGIDFDTPFGPDGAHKYNPKDRMYVINYAGIELQ